MDTNIINYCNDTETIYGILDIFKTNFLEDFKQITKKERPAILKALPYLYRMWYYSTLIDDTPLSPANFINTQTSEVYGEESIVVPISIPIYKNKILKDFKFEYKIFNLDNHPVIEDMKLFLQQCTPDIAVDENGLIIDEERDSFINSLSFKEIFYVTFLTNTAYDLNLLKKMPSINTHRAMAMNKNIEAFFKLSNIEQINNIYDVTISRASNILCKTFTLDKKVFSKESLFKLLKNANNLDEFLYKLYEKYNISPEIDLDELDLESINSLENLNISEKTLMDLNLKFELPFIIDAYLLTPLGYYLQLIQPIYIDSIDFEMLFEEIIDGNNSNVPLIRFFFTISNGYDLTSLGKNLLLAGKSSKNQYQKLIGIKSFEEEYKQIIEFNSTIAGFDFNYDDHDNAFPFIDEIFKTLEKMQSSDYPIKSKITTSPIPIYNDKETITLKNKSYSFKVKHFYNKRSWKTLALKGTQTLEDLVYAIVNVFDLEYGHMYSFFMNNKPYDDNHEITCPFCNEDNKPITTKYKIHDLNLYEKQKFLLIYDFGDDIRFEIEFISVDALEKGTKYPVVKNMSKDYKL